MYKQHITIVNTFSQSQKHITPEKYGMMI